MGRCEHEIHGGRQRPAGVVAQMSAHCARTAVPAESSSAAELQQHRVGAVGHGTQMTQHESVTRYLEALGRLLPGDFQKPEAPADFPAPHRDGVRDHHDVEARGAAAGGVRVLAVCGSKRSFMSDQKAEIASVPSTVE